MNRISIKVLPWASTMLALACTANAETLEVTTPMIIQQNAFTEMGMNFFPSNVIPAETTRTYSGQFSCSFEYDTETLQIEGFKFNGGAILITAYGLQCQDFITYPSPTNSKFTIVTKVPYPNATYGMIRLSPETRENTQGQVEYGDVDSEGTLTNLQHKYFADQGNYITTYAIQGNAQNALINNYYPGVNLPYLGTSTVDIREVSSTIYEKSVRAYLTIELDESIVTTLQGNVAALNLNIIETEEGTIVANTGQFKVPTAYGQWATDNGLTKPNPETLNSAGIPYAILFALDLPITATSLPISIKDTPIGPVAKIILPEGGLQNPMIVEYSADLTDNPWPALPVNYYLDGVDSLELGMTGEARFSLPSGNAGFIRFVTAVE